MNQIVFMPSTPLNVLISCAVALQKSKDSKMQIWLIDQKTMQNNPYFEAILDWSDSPFEDIKIFSGQARGLKKLFERYKNFKQLKTLLMQFVPNYIAVGSDRRIEFQFAIQWLKKNNITTQGLYLDDGLYSYAGRPSHWLKDFLTMSLKKLVYGFWWEEPKSIGASSLIDQAWLFQPSLAISPLQQKTCIQIDKEWFNSSELKALSERLAKKLNINLAKLPELDLLVLIPHPNNIKKMVGYQARLQKWLIEQSLLGKKIGVKYHPRTQQEDLLNLKSIGVYEIVAQQMAFEFCLPLLNSHCHVIGDVGTALLTTKWLREDLMVIAVLDKKDEFQKRFISLTQAMNICIVGDYIDVKKVGLKSKKLEV